MTLTVENKYFRFTIGLSRTRETIGINSILPDGNHVLFWDFDTDDYYFVKQALEYICGEFNLPTIYVLRTVNGYHAYCMHRSKWPFVLMVLSSTPGIDMTFFKIGVMREYFTLRIKPKAINDLDLVDIINEIGYPDETVDIEELIQHERYITKR